MRELIQTGSAVIRTPALNSETGRLAFQNNSALSDQACIGITNYSSVSPIPSTANAVALGNGRDAFLTLLSVDGRLIYDSVPLAALWGGMDLYTWYVRPFFVDLLASYVSYRDVPFDIGAPLRFQFSLKLGTYEG